MCHARPLETLNAIQKRGMTLSMATVAEAIGIHAVLIRKNAGKMKETAIQIQSAMDH